MGSMMGIFDIIFLGAGLYVLYAWILMKTTGEIKTSVLMSQDVKLKKCKDLEGYKKFIAPRMLTFGIFSTLYGIAGLINTYVILLPMPVYLGMMGVFFIVLIWYAVQSKKGVQMFW